MQQIQELNLVVYELKTCTQRQQRQQQKTEPRIQELYANFIYTIYIVFFFDPCENSFSHLSGGESAHWSLQFSCHRRECNLNIVGVVAVVVVVNVV